MKRTQLYLDDDLWEALHVRARTERTSISDLVRRAARERYLGDLEERRKAMLAIVGIGKDNPEFSDSAKYVRRMRRDRRMERLWRP
jgi:predicted CopG family antitoxin